MKKKLLIFTQSFPYVNAAEGSFLIPEINKLLVNFDLIFCPEFKGSKKYLGIYNIDETFCDGRKKNLDYLTVLINSYFIKDLIFLIRSGKLKALKYTFSFYVKMNYFRRELDKFADVDCFYSYWFESRICATKLFYPKKLSVTRVHGFDIYSEFNKHGFIPGQKNLLGILDKVFCISNHGMRYLENLGFTNLDVSRLGIDDICENEIHSNYIVNKIYNYSDKVLLVSCSSVIPLKRVRLIMRAVKSIAVAFPDLYFEWTHIGGGIEFDDLVKISSSEKLENLSIKLLGSIENTEVRQTYLTNHFNLFIHASLSEGMPVAIQEALMFGIPFVSLDAGGIIEILDYKAGFVLENSKNDDIALENLISGIKNYIFLSDSKKKELELNARIAFLEMFNAEVNHNIFSQKLRSLCEV